MSTTPVFKMTPPWTPEMLPDVQRTIEDYLEKLPHSAYTLEIGSGWSTLWLVTNPNVGYLASFEDNAEWYREVTRAMNDEPKARHVCKLRLADSKDIPQSVSTLGAEFDLVMIDGGQDEDRLSILFASLAKLRPGGWLVVDDTHWPMFKSLGQVLYETGYPLLNRFGGSHTRKTGEVKYHQTNIYVKGS